MDELRSNVTLMCRECSKETFFQVVFGFKDNLNQCSECFTKEMKKTFFGEVTISKKMDDGSWKPVKGLEKC